MAIISANIQYNRGEHSLLDFSSLQENYSTALLWAKNPYSNAAVGQYIYLLETEEIDSIIYTKGPYIVEAIGETPIITSLRSVQNQVLSITLERVKIDNVNYIVAINENGEEVNRINIDNTTINAGEY